MRLTHASLPEEAKELDKELKALMKVGRCRWTLSKLRWTRATAARSDQTIMLLWTLMLSAPHPRQ